MERKVVIVTGSRRGLGKATIEEFAKKGYDVVINDREEPEVLEALAKKIEANYHVNALAIFADISNEGEVVGLLNKVINTFGRIDVLVNNASIVYDIPIIEKTTQMFNETLNNNLTGTFITSKHIGKYMYDNKKGKIINISSTNASKTFFPYSLDYDASKAGIETLTHNFAMEYAPYVNVNCVAPCWMNTDMNSTLDEETIKEETAKIALKRFADPSEVAHLIYFLASEDASYINATIITIDGGYKYI